ncbi:thrombospondin type 3 repeat-containing protein [candidate division CSSED10-310 bacterium]|uniref:Thrombospondin type 3 repeat-containing protein n=1 Tax=candidate division CSSED10-310 bacterium TaxID=2855610 RepID=A0ABV6YSC8_UNCC1
MTEKKATITAWPAGSVQYLTYDWDCGMTPPGTYYVETIVSDVLGNMAYETKSFQLISDADILCDLFLNKQEYETSENVLINATLNSIEQYSIWDDVVSAITIYDEQGTTVQSAEKIFPWLFPGEYQTFQLQWQTTVPGSYAVVHQILVQGTTACSVTETFTVSEPALPMLNATINVEPDILFLGDEVTINYEIVNTGNAATGAVTIDIQLIDVDTLAILEVLGHDEHSLTLGLASGDSFTDTLAYLVSDPLALGSYLVRIIATAPDLTATASDTFTIIEVEIPPPPTIPPLTITSPDDGFLTAIPSIDVTGLTDPGIRVRLLNRGQVDQQSSISGTILDGGSGELSLIQVLVALYDQNPLATPEPIRPVRVQSVGRSSGEFTFYALAAGNYYLFATIDSNNDGQFDHLGYYQNLSGAAEVIVTDGTNSIEGITVLLEPAEPIDLVFSTEFNAIQGSLASPEPAPTSIVALFATDPRIDPTARPVNLTIITNVYSHYRITNTEPGSYYVFAASDTDGDGFISTASGDLYGCYWSVDALLPDLITIAEDVWLSDLNITVDQDDPADIQFFIDDPYLSMTSDVLTGSFIFEDVALVEGTNSFEAEAVNNEGIFSGPLWFDVILDSIHPQIRITAPADGLCTANNSVTITGEVIDATETIISLNNVTHTIPAGGGQFIFQDVILQLGFNCLTVTGIDAAGNESISNTITVLYDELAPTGTFTFPQDEQCLTTMPALDDLVLNVSDDFDDSPQITLFGPDPIPDSNDCQWQYSALASDCAGNENTISVVFTVDEQAPQVMIDGINEGDCLVQLPDPTLVTVSATDNCLSPVETTLSGPTASAECSYYYEASAVDCAGNASSTTVTFTVDDEPPQITIHGVTDGACLPELPAPETVTTSSTDNCPTQIDEILLGPVSVGHNIYYYQAFVSDCAGNNSNDRVNFMVDRNGDCCYQRVTASNGTFNTYYEFDTIQEAVDVATEGWHIYVCPGKYDEVVVITNVSGHGASIIIEGYGMPVVRGFIISSTNSVTIQGFNIDATGTRKPAIAIIGGDESNCNLSITRNAIHNTDLGYHGITIGSNNPFLNITENDIYQNGLNGIHTRTQIGGPFLIKNNNIFENGKNGVRLAPQSEAQLTGNLFYGNGTYNAECGEGYGFMRERTSGTGNPGSITLTNNYFCTNSGFKIPGQSSVDIGNYDQTLDPEDSNNYTTSGCENPGIVGECGSIDADHDNIPDIFDNCPTAANTNQIDTDSDTLGDACDPDDDDDGLEDVFDNCPLVPNLNQLDQDDDGVGDNCDFCPNTPPSTPVDAQGCPAQDGHGNDIADPAVIELNQRQHGENAASLVSGKDKSNLKPDYHVTADPVNDDPDLDSSIYFFTQSLPGTLEQLKNSFLSMIRKLTFLTFTLQDYPRTSQINPTRSDVSNYLNNPRYHRF